MSLLRFHAPKALSPASLHRGSSTTSRTNITPWALHPRSPSITRTFISPSQPRFTDSPPWRSSQTYEGRPHQQQQETDGQRANRALIITGLNYDVTITELLQSIARTAPVGAISSAFLLPSQSTHAYYPNPRSRWPPAHGDMLGAGAKISFNQRWSAMELVRLAREKVFRVRDRTPFVTEDRRASLRYDNHNVPPPLNQYLQTRVLVLEGPRSLEDFDEASVRRLLTSNGGAMMDAGPFGDLSEPVITKNLKNDMRRMEWRFFAYAAQALPFKKVIRSHFGNRLSVKHGRDPCCPVFVWEVERRKNREHAEALFKAKKARRGQEIPIEARGKEGGRKIPESPTDAPKLETEHTGDQGRGWNMESPIWAWQPATEHSYPAREGHLDNATVAFKTASDLSTETNVDQGRGHGWNEHMEDLLVTRQTTAEQTNGTFAHQGREPIWKEELDVADRSVSREDDVEEATETASVKPIETTAEQGMGPSWKEEHVADGLVTRETIVEQTTETAVEQGPGITAEQGIGPTWKEGHLGTATVALDTTAEQSTETHAEQGRQQIREEEHLGVGLVSREATADQDREHIDEGRDTTAKHLSLALIAVEAR